MPSAARPWLLIPIIQVESGGDPLAIGDNTARKSYAPKSRDAAIQLAFRLIAQGHNIDMGLMQVNSCHLSDKVTIPALFDSCQNIRIGTSILSDFYRQNKLPGDPVQSLFRALSAYNTGRNWKGAGYVNRILEAAGASYRVTAPAGTFSGPPPREPQVRRILPPVFRQRLFTSEAERALTNGGGERGIPGAKFSPFKRRCRSSPFTSLVVTAL